MTPRVISQDLYASVVTVANANAAAYAQVASAHQDVAGKWMGRAANLPETNAGAAVDAAAGQAQRQAVAHQNEADALNASADYHRQAQALGNEMNNQLDRLDRRAQNLLDGFPPSWHPTIRALANAAGRALGDLYGMRLWQAQEAAGSVITPLHDAIGGLGGPSGAAPAPTGNGSGESGTSNRIGPRSAVSQAVPMAPADASAAAPAAASQPAPSDPQHDLVPVMVGLPVGGGAPADAQPPAIKPDDSDDDNLGGGDPPDGGGGTIEPTTAGVIPASANGVEHRAVTPKPPPPAGAVVESQHPPASAEPSMASPVESTTPLAAAPAAADRKRAKAQPKIGARSHEPK